MRKCRDEKRKGEERTNLKNTADGRWDGLRQPMLRSREYTSYRQSVSQYRIRCDPLRLARSKGNAFWRV
jgi:hypothetical protein